MFKSSVLIIASILLLSVYSKSIPNDYDKDIEGNLFEGDIAGIPILRGAAQNLMANRTKWANNTIPYQIVGDYNATELETILTGIKLIEDATRIGGKDCIRIVPRTNEENYVRIINGSGCSSYVGHVGNGYQNLSLQIPGCVRSGIVAHEFIHALGFWHEQSRPDRDNYIKINIENIQDDKIFNFNKYNESLVGLLDFPYDYGSIMHYRNNTFTKNKKETITPLQEGVVIGQRIQLSQIDVDELRRYYECE